MGTTVLEPIPESRQAIEELEPSVADHDVLAELRGLGSQVRDVVPDCVGVSLTSPRYGVTMTLLASWREVELLDALHRGGSGSRLPPTVRDTLASCDVTDPLDERTWWLCSGLSAAPGVVATLTLPILIGECVSGSVTLYGGSMHAFEGHHEQLAEIFSAWAPGAVSNADLSFSTIELAREAPRRLRSEARLAAAVGLLAGYLDLPVECAQHLLAKAARRAGIEQLQLAEALLSLARGGSTD